MAANIGIIGGGIAGLSSAYRLASQGHQVTLFESSQELGGLGTFFDYKNRKIDRFYHCIMPSDVYLLQLINDVGLTDQLYWRHTSMGMVYRGNHYPFNTALDLLRFTPLSFLKRIRLGAMSLLLKYLGNDDRLDHTPISTWLTQLFGAELWESFWQPMFAAKFGTSAGALPSLYLKKRLGRESNTGSRGYLQGGLYSFIQALSREIFALKGDIRLGQRVKHLHQQGQQLTLCTEEDDAFEFDAVISTIPLSLLTKIAQGLACIQHLPKVTYQGVVNLLVFLDRPIDGYYWTPILHSETPFDGLVETSSLINLDQYGGYHTAYLMKYTHRDSDLFSRASNVIADDWLRQFLRIYRSRGITEKNIVDRLLFKAPFVEPIYPLGYTQHKPGIRLADSNLYLATTAQVYPYITSWNSSVRVADECVTTLMNNL